MFSLLSHIAVEAGLRYGPDGIKKLRDMFSRIWNGGSDDTAAIYADAALFETMSQRMANQLFKIGITEGWDVAVNLYSNGYIGIELLTRIGAAKEAEQRRSLMSPVVLSSAFGDGEKEYLAPAAEIKMRSAVFAEAEKYDVSFD
jgi:hypothetical protein